MNKRFKLTLLILTTSQNKGVSLAFALMIGMGMLLTASMTLMNGSQHKNQVTAQEFIENASSNADVAATRIAYFLNQHRELITKPTEQWETVANEMMTTSGSGDTNNIQGIACDSTAETGGRTSSTYSEEANKTMLNNLITQSWISIDENEPSAGAYRLRQYQLDSIDDPKMVKLQVESSAIKEDNTDVSLNNAISSIEVTLPIIEPLEGLGFQMPGLWISDTTGGTGGLGDNSKQSSGTNQPINAVTWIDCTQMADWETNTSYVNDGKISTAPIAMEKRTITPPSIKQVKDDLPNVPASPWAAYDLGSLNASNCYITLPRTPGNNWGGDADSECETINDRTSDTPLDGVYYYKFTGDVIVSKNIVKYRQTEFHFRNPLLFYFERLILLG